MSRFNGLGTERTRFSFLAAAQKLNATLKMRRKEILASRIGDDALFGTAVLPVSFHRMYSNSTPSAPLALTVRRYMICHDQNAEQSGYKSSLNLRYDGK
jgi:hypothetical protein